MGNNHLAIKRQHILGDLYNLCEPSSAIPVYIEGKPEEPIGYADESLGFYVDAFLFHIPEDICRKLATGHFSYGFDYDLSGNKNKIKLNYILLISNSPQIVKRRTALTATKE